MDESVTYQEIVRKGMAQGAGGQARRLLLSAGRKKFGPPDQSNEDAVAAIADRDRLEQIVERVFDVDGWQELLSPPA